MKAIEEIIPLITEVVTAFKCGMEWKLLREFQEDVPVNPTSTIGKLDKFLLSYPHEGGRNEEDWTLQTK